MKKSKKAYEIVRIIDGFWQPRLLILFAVSFTIGVSSAEAQVTKELTKLVMEPKHTEYARTQNPNTPQIQQVTSSDPGVATATAYRNDRVQIVAVAPGNTTVEFWDNAQRILYRVPVWVTAPNSTGGGGEGYNSKLTQLPQIEMLVKHTENVHTPDDPAARISGVKSSNPGVATARTDPPRGIQIFSVALGDTFVEFTDNTTGTTYQVHVWVQDKLSGPGGGGNNPPKPNPNTKPGPKPNPAPGPGPGGERLDPCLVGSWISESTSVSTDAFSTSGMSGISLIIKADRRIIIDYDSMQPKKFVSGITGEVMSEESASGTATGHIVTNDGSIFIKSIESSAITDTETTFGENGMTFTKRDVRLGRALMPSSTTKYECGKETLKLKGMVDQFVFKRND